MKKAILITGVSLLLSAGVITTATFLALKNKKEDVFPKETHLNLYNTSTDLNVLPNEKTSIKELLLGTTKVNDGNYIIYIGTNTNLSNNDFLYNNKENQINSLNDLKNNHNLVYKGAFFKALKNLNDYKDQDIYESVPRVFNFIDTVNDDLFKTAEEYEQKISDLRKSTIDREKNYGNSQSEKFNFNINAKHKDINGKEVYYRTDERARIMREILAFVSGYIKNSQLVDIYDGNNPGIVLFYTKETIKNGPSVYYGSVKLEQTNQNQPGQRPPEPKKYDSGNSPFNSDLADFGGQINAGIYQTYKKK
ncbi:DUF6856 family protein [Ureaplasma canigenitalium]|uniref:DUF6856 family protein n=1 Tax=Ureaplasma canigenitalium TaxID=42092 RepID=UPI0004E24F98|nr:hypothetical protein [Ureaplasma canigenitalium]